MPVCSECSKIWAPMSVGAMEPVGMTNPSVTKPRKVIASTNAMISDCSVSTMLVSCDSCAGAEEVLGMMAMVERLVVARLSGNAEGSFLRFRLVLDHLIFQ